MYAAVKCRSTLVISFFLSTCYWTYLMAVFYIVVIVVIERQHYILNVTVSQHTFVLRFLNLCCLWNYQA